MAKLNHEKKYPKHQTREIGADDDAPTPIWQIKNEVRRRLYRERPNLSREELERRVHEIVARGMKRAA
jgi:hypothetical protein